MDSAKVPVKLVVAADGRTAENWEVYSSQLEGFLSGKTVADIPLDCVLFDKDEGKEPADPGASASKEARKERSAWERANSYCYFLISTSLPESLQPAAARYKSSAAKLWKYLSQRFSDVSLVSLAAMYVRLNTIKLADYGCVADFIAALQKAKQDLVTAGETPSTASMASLILQGMGNSFPLAKNSMMDLPRHRQTEEEFTKRLVDAEKYAALETELNTVNVGDVSVRSPPAAVNAATKRPAAYSPCTYVRKRNGYGSTRKAGTVCGFPHKPGTCWAARDDEWLAANPTKTAADLPDWRQEARNRRAGASRGAAVNQVTVQLTPEVLAQLLSNASVSGSSGSGVSVPPSLFGNDSEKDSSSYSGYTLAHGETGPRPDHIASKEDHAGLPPKQHAIPLLPVTVALDSGATASCFKQGSDYKPLAIPVSVRGALPGKHSLARGTTSLPCPAVRTGSLRGLHSPEFRHNLISVSELQQHGVEILFPAGSRQAQCKDPQSGQVLWTFEQGDGGLYETSVEEASVTVTSPSAHALHPSVLLHSRLGHMGEGSIQSLIKHRAIQGLPTSYTPPPCPPPQGCSTCIQAKAHARPHPRTDARAAAPLDRIHADLVGPLPPNLKGQRYWVTLVDDSTRHGWSLFLRTKDEAPQRILNWIRHAERQFGRKVKSLHTDQGGEFLNSYLQQHLQAMGVRHTYSTARTPQQNGIAEARNKQVQIFARALLTHANAPDALWHYAVAHATHLNNLVPHRLLHHRTPHELLHGTKPSAHRLRVWGCVAHALVHKQARINKLRPVTRPYMLVGLNPSGPGWLLYDPTTRQELATSDVYFQEHIPHYASGTPPPVRLTWDSFHPSPTLSTSPSSPSPPPSGSGPATPPAASASGAEASGGDGDEAASTPDGERQPDEAGQLSASKSGAPHQQDHLPQQGSPAESHDSGQQNSSSELSQALLDGILSMGPRGMQPLARYMHPQSSSAPAQQVAPPQAQTEGPRRSARLRGLDPEVLTVRSARYAPRPLPSRAVHCLKVIVEGESGCKAHEIPTPQTWQEALSGQWAAEWLESMVREIAGLDQSKTFKRVAKDKAGNILHCKWVYRIKRRPDGTPLFKSRLCIKGCQQKEGVDYFETYAPTARHVSVRVVLHLAATLGLHVRVLDVEQAFVHGELEERVYMAPPPGLGEAYPFPTGEVWQLQKPLYGLKQAPRQWHEKLKGVLRKLGYVPAHGDPSLFVKTDAQGDWILVYVDDMLLLSKTEAALDRLRDQLKEEFPIKDLGDVGQYLGMEVARDWEKKEIRLTQARYVKDLLRKFGGEEIKEYDTPLQVNHGLVLPKDQDLPLPQPDRYPELVGSLMYLMVCTRPDLAHALSVLSRFVGPGRHGSSHWKAALRVLGYVKRTSHLGLVLGGASAQLTGYSDSSWADDQLDRRSSQGHCFTLGQGVISWRASRSPAVALSSCEAELYAACAASQESVWLGELLQTLGCVQEHPPILWCDNTSTISLTKDAVFSGRSKHIEARYYFVRELVQAGRLQTAHIPGTDNVADIFTKPLLSDDHYKLVAKLGLR